MLPLYKCFEHWSDFSTVWIYSDPHFGDKDQKLMDKSWPSDEEQLKRINSKVGKNDTIIILGDIGDINFARQIKGYKILIMGNHDSGKSNYTFKSDWRTLLKNEYPSKQEAIKALKEDHPDFIKFTVSDYPFFWVVNGNNNLFEEVYEGPLMVSEKLILSHEPVDVPWAFNIHGHDHAGFKPKTGSLNVCSNVIGWEPINLNKLFKDGFASKIPSIHRMTINKAIEHSLKKEETK